MTDEYSTVFPPYYEHAPMGQGAEMRENPPYYLTAYGLAVKHGFVGTEEEWLASLKGEIGPGLVISGHYETLEDLEAAVTDPVDGEAYDVGAGIYQLVYYWSETQGVWRPLNIHGPQGEPGEDGEPGPKGEDGADGMSAYEQAVEAGYTGTEAEFTALLADLPSYTEQAREWANVSGEAATEAAAAAERAEEAAERANVPDPSTAAPQMDGTAAPGSSEAWSRGDHVHPSDTSRVPVTRTVNGKALSADIELDVEDVGAVPDTELDAATATASGAVASFETASAQVLPSVVVDVEPVQAGSGDPSPDNVRPISGWNAVNVWRTGKNLLRTTAESKTQNGITFTVNADGTIHVSGTSTAQTSLVIGRYTIKEADTYYYSGTPSGGSPSTYRTYLSWGGNEVGGGASRALTVGTSVSATISINTGVTIDATFKPMLCKMSDGTDYEPYSGNEYTIQLGDTYYGGTLDVTNGVLTVDRAMVDLGTLSWTYASGSALNLRSATDIGVLPPVTIEIAPNAISSVYPVLSYSNALATDKSMTIVFASSEQAGNVWVHDSSYSDAASFKAAVTGQTLVYELATPITIPLTPTQISTLQGQNNVWADSGDVTVTYRTGQVALLSDVAAAAEGAQAQTEALEATVDGKASASVIAPVEASSTASTNYAVGDYLMLNGVLYEVTAAIASGETITPGTNVSATTVTGITDGLNTRTTALETALDGLVSRLGAM